MDTVIFSAAGVFLIVVGVILARKHSRFLSQCIEVKGRVDEVNDTLHIRRGSFGQVTDKSTIKTPVIQYRYNKNYQFEAEVDVRSHGLTTGSNVTVCIDPLRPKTARLNIGLAQSSLVFKIMIGLGIVCLAVGMIQFKPSNFDLSLLDNLFMLAVIFFVGVFLYVRLSPLMSLLRYMPVYHENAQEVIEPDDSRGNG